MHALSRQRQGDAPIMVGIFPTGDSDDALDLEDTDREWRKGAKLESGSDFWWRLGNTPEVSVTGPVGQCLAGQWQFATLDSGKPYLWRSTGNDVEVNFWEHGTLVSGEEYWYDEDGEVTFTDPYASFRACMSE